MRPIIIEDVTGYNAGYMTELSRAGYTAGAIVLDYRIHNGTVYFNDCIAYMGETCRYLEERKQLVISYNKGIIK